MANGGKALPLYVSFCLLEFRLLGGFDNVCEADHIRVARTGFK